jgi:hypothetical protein
LGALVGAYGYESSPVLYDAASVTTSSTAATYDFQCLHGETGPIRPDARGAFSIGGSLVPKGGLVRTISNVTFSGVVSGDTMTLTVTWPTTIITATGEKPDTSTFGPVTLTKGLAPTRWPGCI